MSALPATPRPHGSFTRPVLFAVLLALVLMGAGILLLGIPGAVYMELTVPVVEVALGAPRGTLFRGDAGWGTALMMTVAVPVPIPLLLWLGLRRFQGRVSQALLATLTGEWVWAVLLLLVLSTTL